VRLKLELHQEKSKIGNLSGGVDFVGFRNFYYFRLLRKRSIKGMELKIRLYNNKEISRDKIEEIFQGWKAHSDLSNNYNLLCKITKNP